MTNPTLITTPFAENGDKNVIPNVNSDPTKPQLASNDVGFPPITQQKVSEGGIPPERKDFNGILNLYGQHIVHLNKGLPYEFDQAFANAIGGYPLNARLMLDNGDIVKSTVPNNTTNPNTSTTGWVKANSTEQIFDPSGHSQYEINRMILWYVSPLLFGAIGDGVADDSQPVRDCFNFIKANNVIFSDWSYSEYNLGSNVQVVAPNQKIIIQGNVTFKSDVAYIEITGSNQEVGYISSSANRGDRNITLNTSIPVSQGDLIAIHNSRTSSLSSHRPYYYDGEVRMVESISSNVVTLRSQLESSYPSGTPDKVWKINPVNLDITGVKFIGNYTYALKITLAAFSNINVIALNLLNSSTSHSALYLDKVFYSRVTGGKYIKEGIATGTDYGVVVANSQDVLVTANYIYGGRHGCAMGGSNDGMNVPNRRIVFHDSVIANDPTSNLQAADFHGNCIDCSYERNTIYGRVSYSGRNSKTIGNEIIAPFGDVRVPLGLSEIIGGVSGSYGDNVSSTGSASFVCGWLSSTTIQATDEDFTFEARNIRYAGNPNLVGFRSILNMDVVNNWVLDEFALTGSAPLYNRHVSYSAGSLTIQPAYIQITNPKNSFPESVSYITGDATLTNTAKNVYPSYGSNANGRWVKNSDGTMICSHTLSGTIPLNTPYTGGGYKSDDLVWTFPKAFLSAPNVTPNSKDNSCTSAKAIGETTTQATVFGLSAIAFASNTGINIKVEARGRHLS